MIPLALLLTLAATTASPARAGAPPARREPAWADCPAGLSVSELIEDLAAARARFPGAGTTPLMSVVLYEDCRAALYNSPPICDALSGIPRDLIVPHHFEVPPDRVARQAAGHCRTALAVMNLQLHRPGFEEACLTAWDLPVPREGDAEAICAAVKRHYPSARRTCLELSSRRPWLMEGGVRECVRAMGEFFGDFLSCGSALETLGDRETCGWLRWARFGLPARGSAVLTGAGGACRGYATPDAARLCRVASPRLARARLRALLATPPSPAREAELALLAALNCAPDAGLCRMLRSGPHAR